MEMSTNITWHEASITKVERQQKNGYKSFILWFTGLSGSGKSTIANSLAKTLFNKGIQAYVLDGDNIRHGLNRDLGFSDDDRKENIRRIGEVSKLFVDSGQIVITAFISPFQEDRDHVRQLVKRDEFIEVYIKCSLESCEERDPKGLYKRARNGEIKQFTGIDAPYEPPLHPEIEVDTEKQSVEESVDKIYKYLSEHGFIEKGE